MLEGISVADVMDHDVSGVPPGLTLDTFADQMLDGAPRAAVAVMRGPDLLGDRRSEADPPDPSRPVGRDPRRRPDGQWRRPATGRTRDVAARRARPAAPQRARRPARRGVRRADRDRHAAGRGQGRRGGRARTATACGRAARRPRERRSPAQRRGGPGRRVRGDRRPDAGRGRLAVGGARPRARRAPSRARSPCHRGTTPRWTATRSAPADVGRGDRRRAGPPRGHRRGPGGPGAGGDGPAWHGGPHRDRGAGPAGRRCRRPGRGDHPARRGRRRRRVHAAGTRPGRCPPAILVHTAVAVGGSIRRAGSDLAGGCPDPRRRHGPHAGGRSAWRPASDSISSASIAARSSGSSRPATRSARPAATSGRRASPTPTGPGLVAMVEAAGGDPRVLGIAKDRLDDVKSRICAGLVEGADALIVSGGVSVGPYDVVRAAFEAFGTVDLWRVAVQPGKPFAFGTGRAPADTARPEQRPPALLFGLPGNPVSTFVTFELFVRPAIRRLAGSSRRRPVPAARSGGAGRAGHQEQRPAGVRPRHRRARRARHARDATTAAGSRRAWPVARAARAATCCPRSPRPTPSPSSPRPTTASRPAPRSSCGGSTAPDALPGAWSRPLSSGRDGPQGRPVDCRRAPSAAGSPTSIAAAGRGWSMCRPSPITARRAVAEATVSMSAETLSLVIDGGGPKGDVLGVAELAGVMGGKRTSELIPLCHPLAADRPAGLDHARPGRRARCGSGPRPPRPARPASRWRP